MALLLCASEGQDAASLTCTWKRPWNIHGNASAQGTPDIKPLLNKLRCLVGISVQRTAQLHGDLIPIILLNSMFYEAECAARHMALSRALDPSLADILTHKLQCRSQQRRLLSGLLGEHLLEVVAEEAINKTDRPQEPKSKKCKIGAILGMSPGGAEKIVRHRVQKELTEMRHGQAQKESMVRDIEAIVEREMQSTIGVELGRIHTVADDETSNHPPPEQTDSQSMAPIDRFIRCLVKGLPR